MTSQNSQDLKFEYFLQNALTENLIKISTIPENKPYEHVNNQPQHTTVDCNSTTLKDINDISCHENNVELISSKN